MTPDAAPTGKYPWTYTCPACRADIVADQCDHVKVMCPTCGAGPYETEHECDAYGDGECSDLLYPWEE